MDDDEEEDADTEDREATADTFIVKLQDLSQIFDQKNRQYLDMEAAYEECKKVSVWTVFIDFAHIQCRGTTYIHVLTFCLLVPA